MEINFSTRYSVGDSIYKVGDDCSIREYKVTQVLLSCKAKEKDTACSISYSITHCNGCSPIIVEENSLSVKGYFKSKKDVLKYIAEQI